MAKPPVCKIMDYGKFKYETKKKANEAKKKQTVVKLKEVKFRPKTEEHDYNFKVKAVKEFLEEGNKARITVMFRGREITHREIGQAILTRIGVELKEQAIIEQAPRLEGRLLFMILSPNPRWLQSIKTAQERAERLAAKAASGGAAAAAAPAPAATSDAAPAAKSDAAPAAKPVASPSAPPPAASEAAPAAKA
jgi:translation initiation factor IF-3